MAGANGVGLKKACTPEGRATAGRRRGPQKGHGSATGCQIGGAGVNSMTATGKDQGGSHPPVQIPPLCTGGCAIQTTKTGRIPPVAGNWPGDP